MQKPAAQLLAPEQSSIPHGDEQEDNKIGMHNIN
jgi:hypothetical protein